jgi:arylsulfatase A-like enzyme
MRRSKLLVALLLTVAVAATLVVALVRRGHMPRAIVLIVIDTLRRDALSCYGGQTPTPNIAALAEAGTVFQNAVGSYHQTTMSMAALFTGHTPSIESGIADKPLPWDSRTWCGLTRLARNGDVQCVPAGAPSLAEALRAAGYTTVGFPSNELLFRPAGYDRGFDQWFEVPSEQSGLVGPVPDEANQRPSPLRTGAWVNHLVRAWLDGPLPERLFLYVHYMDVHDWPLGKYPYAAGVARVDTLVGELRAMLSARGVLDDAVVVLTADHGEALDEVHPIPAPPNHFGNPSFEPVLRVPLIVSPPVTEDPTVPMRSDGVYRLIRRMARLGPGPENAEVRDDEHFVGEMRFQTYRRGRWKSMWPRQPGPPILFDLQTDPAEQTDLAATHPAELAAHRRRIDELARQLAAAPLPERALTDEERARLRALGYAE